MKREIPTRNKTELLPSFDAFVDEIDKNGITEQLLYKIIRRHKANATYNRNLWDRYMAINGGVPIFDREPRYQENKPINNKVNNDFLGEIIDFKVGYFAGVPFAYGYSSTGEAEGVTGGKEAVDAATKAVTDFVTRNNMFGVDMETTKNATTYGYSGRLFYIDPEGEARVMPVPGFQTIILSKTAIYEPKYAVRYYEVTDINDAKSWVVEFYDNSTVKTYKGMLSALKFENEEQHGFAYCPLQGIPNNAECMGDAEKVLTEIDAYDKALSDNVNEMEAFAHAYLIFEGLRIDDDTISKGQASGSFVFPPSGTVQGKAYYLTKQINDAFTEHNLARLEENIYRFSKTPNMNKDIFSSASGKALKFRIHQLETKCATFDAQVMNAAMHMWRVLSSYWSIKGIKVDPLQCTVETKRNFPVDALEEAQTAQAQISAGLPKKFAFEQMSSVDDVDYVMGLLEEEQDSVEELYPALAKANKTAKSEENPVETQEETQEKKRTV